MLFYPHLSFTRVSMSQNHRRRKKFFNIDGSSMKGFRDDTTTTSLETRRVVSGSSESVEQFLDRLNRERAVGDIFLSTFSQRKEPTFKFEFERG